MAHTKSSMRKAIKDMTFKQQLASLAKDPRFKELVGDIRQSSPARQDALEDSLVAMEAEGHPPTSNTLPPVVLRRNLPFKELRFPGVNSE